MFTFTATSRIFPTTKITLIYIGISLEKLCVSHVWDFIFSEILRRRLIRTFCDTIEKCLNTNDFYLFVRISSRDFQSNKHRRVWGFFTEKQWGTQVKPHHQPILIMYIALLVCKLNNPNPNSWYFNAVFVSHCLFVD